MLLEKYQGPEFIIRLEYDPMAHQKSLPNYILTAQHLATLQVFYKRSDDPVELSKLYEEWARVAGKPVDE